jgi:phosphoglycolate phosphatase
VTPRLVIFDVDGTLVDSRSLILAAVRETAMAMARPVPEPTFALSGVGLSLEPLMQSLFPDEDDPAFVRHAVEAYKTAFHRLRADPMHHEPAFPGALDVIDTLAARDDCVLGIATGKSRRGIAAILDRFDWHTRFATIQTADDAPSKPSPVMVMQAMAETAVEASNTVVVGDTSFDMEMARSAGAAAIGVAWGNHPVANLHAAGASAVIDRFDDLHTVLDQLWAKRDE